MAEFDDPEPPTDASSSEFDGEKNYVVEEILAQREDRGETMYLTKWANYNIVRATWEPPSSFGQEDDDIDAHQNIIAWRRKRRREHNGKADPFDVDALESRQNVRRNRIAARHKAKEKSENLSAQSSLSTKNDAKIARLPALEKSSVTATNNISNHGKIKPKRAIVDSEDSSDEVPISAAIAARKNKGIVRIDSDDEEDSEDSLLDDVAITVSPVAMPTPNPKLVGETAAGTESIMTAKSGEMKQQSLPTQAISKTISSKNTEPESRGGIAGSVRSLLPGKERYDPFANINKPKQQRAKQPLARVAGDDQFQKLSQRRRFERFGQIDRVPDHSSLFVSGDESMEVDPPAIAAEPIETIGTRTKEQHIQTNDETAQPLPFATGSDSALRTAKVPLACYSYFREGRCSRGTGCPFSHDETDGYELSDSKGFVPPKYWNPPETCWYWWHVKCAYADKDCNFAHYNTGLIAANPENRGAVPTPVEKSELPPSGAQSERRSSMLNAAVAPVCRFWMTGYCWNGQSCQHAHPENKLAETRPRNGIICPWFQKGYCNKGKKCKYAHADTNMMADVPPKKPTCYFWNRDGNCSQGDRCAFAHSYTGVIADPPRKEKTCYFWYKKGSCNLEDKCPWAHSDTGMIADPPGGRVQLTCYFWAQGHCNKGESCTYAHEPGHPIAERPFQLKKKASLSRMDTTTDSAVDSLAEAQEERVEPVQEIAAPIEFSLTVRDANRTWNLETVLEGLDMNAKDRLQEFAGRELAFSVDRLCLQADFREFIDQGHHYLTQGQLSPSPKSSQQYELVAGFLNSRKLSALIFHEHFTIIVFSTAAEERFQLYAHFIQPLRKSIELLDPATIDLNSDWDPDETALQLIFRARYGVTLDYIFQASKLGGDQSMKNVFLMIDDTSHEFDLNLWKIFFLDAGASVFDSSIKGSWDYFRKHFKKGVIIIHSDLYSLHEVNELWSILLKGDMHVFRAQPLKHWTTPTSNDSDERVLSRLFPNGTLILITDDIFVHHPSQALSIVKELKSRHIKRNTRLAGRPGLIDWLLDTLISNEISKKSRAQQQNRADMIQHLEEYSSVTFPDEPMFPSRVLSEDPDHMPRYHNLWKKDEAAATEYLAEWFAGMAVLHAPFFRRFIIVHPVLPTWKHKYQHLRVMTPDTCLDFLCQ